MKHYYIVACISMCQLAVIALSESPEQALKNTAHDVFCFESYLKPLNKKRNELKKLQDTKSSISKWFNKYKVERLEKQIASLKQALKDEGCRIMIDDDQ